MKLVFYLIPIGCEFFLPCFFATQINVMSEKLATALFHSNWYSADRNFKVLVTIFMEFAKKPIKIKAMGIFEVNMENFVAVCRSAYSLFAILQKVEA
jgi:hypothetical protein